MMYRYLFPVLGLVFSGCGAGNPIRDCPGFDEHFVPCCSGGSGEVVVEIDGVVTRFSVAGNGGYARQVNCDPDIDFKIVASSTIDLANPSWWDMSSYDSTRYHDFSDVTNSVFYSSYENGVNTLDIEVDQVGDWQISGTFTGTLLRSLDDTDQTIDVLGSFDVETVYFEWSPD